MNHKEEPAWYCVKTQPKRESLASRHLRELEGVVVFCPMLRYRKATRRGKVWWSEAMFPGYVLARFSMLHHERAVTYAHGVAGLVRFGAIIPEVPDYFVETLRREVAEKGAQETLILQPQIEAGEEVEVANGAFSGSKATVVEVLPAKERVRVLLDFLGRPQLIEVDIFSLLLPRKPAV
jgi:transcriptional antiterminator RfaH